MTRFLLRRISLNSPSSSSYSSAGSILGIGIDVGSPASALDGFLPMLFADDDETGAGLAGGDMDVDVGPERAARTLRLEVDLDLDLMEPWERRELVNEKTEEFTALDRKG
jgi:hypothetical protein